MIINLNNCTKAQKLEVGKILNLDFNDGIRRQLAENVDHCPHCGSTSFQKYGKVKGRQRYRCNDCKKTFGTTNNTPFYRSQKDLDQWSDYLELMFESHLSVRKLAKKVGIYYKTSFYWRHKVLNALDSVNMDGKLSGVVEADETYFTLSFKGQRSGLPRKARKRGGEVRVRGLSKEKVCVLTAVDRSRKSLLKSTCLASPKTQDVINVLAPHIARDAVLVTDRHKAYVGLAELLDLTHERLGKATERRKSYHVQNINSMHSNLKRFMRPFNGVATKYLDHYLAFYKWNGQDAVAALMQPTASVTCEQLTQRRMTLK